MSWSEWPTYLLTKPPSLRTVTILEVEYGRFGNINNVRNDGDDKTTDATENPSL
jgi:hypothetical protein